MKKIRLFIEDFLDIDKSPILKILVIFLICTAGILTLRKCADSVRPEPKPEVNKTIEKIEKKEDEIEKTLQEKSAKIDTIRNTVDAVDWRNSN